jgi:hypothetical protein
VLQNTLTIDVPLVDSINSSYGTNAMVSAYTLPRNLAMGNSIESLQVVLEKDESGNSLKATSFDGALLPLLLRFELTEVVSQVWPTSALSARTTGSGACRPPAF